LGGAGLRIRILRWLGVAVLVVVIVGFGFVWQELGQGRSLFQDSGAWFRTGSDTSYGGPLRVGQTYAEEGPRLANGTTRTVTLKGIALQPWCRWTGPGHCQPTANVHVVNVLYLNRYGSLTNDRWPLSERYQAMVPYVRTLRMPLVLPPGSKIDTVYVMEATRPGVYLMPGRWIEYGVTAFGLFHRTYRFHQLGQWGLCVQPARCPSWAASSP
jgi:hypothetical protein